MITEAEEDNKTKYDLQLYGDSMFPAHMQEHEQTFTRLFVNKLPAGEWISVLGDVRTILKMIKESKEID